MERLDAPLRGGGSSNRQAPSFMLTLHVLAGAGMSSR